MDLKLIEVSLECSVNNMFDGAGNATTVDFQFNTGTPVSYMVYSISGALLNDMFTLLGTEPSGEVSWQLTGLQPYAYYTMKMFGQVASNYSEWEVSGAGGETASGTNSDTNNIVDLTVSPQITGNDAAIQLHVIKKFFHQLFSK